MIVQRSGKHGAGFQQMASKMGSFPSEKILRWKRRQERCVTTCFLAADSRNAEPLIANMPLARSHGPRDGDVLRS
jgi:hypothetical protein